jgi:hypothetical protein
MSEEHRHSAIDSLRETDKWLRRVAIYVPIMTFVVGWGTGVISTFILFKDHERRISVLESVLALTVERQHRVIGLLEDEHKINLH